LNVQPFPNRTDTLLFVAVAARPGRIDGTLPTRGGEAPRSRNEPPVRWAAVLVIVTASGEPAQEADTALALLDGGGGASRWRRERTRRTVHRKQTRQGIGCNERDGAAAVTGRVRCSSRGKGGIDVRFAPCLLPSVVCVCVCVRVGGRQAPCSQGPSEDGTLLKRRAARSLQRTPHVTGPPNPARQAAATGQCRRRTCRPGSVTGRPGVGSGTVKRIPVSGRICGVVVGSQL
jgi:hypothetical protein